MTTTTMLLLLCLSGFGWALSSTTSKAPRGRKRRVFKSLDVEKQLPQPEEPFDSLGLALAQTANYEADRLVVPEGMRGEECSQPAFETHSLDALFPGAGLGDAFEGSTKLRHELRLAARRDLCDPSPSRYDGAASAQGGWRTGSFEALGEALSETLGASAPTGLEFVQKITSLTLKEHSARVGHFIEIVTQASKPLNYGWHQDRSGDPSALTVMLGFPATDNYVGCGVFSHIAQLSHAILPEEAASGDFSRPRTFEPSDFNGIPSECVVRPRYARGSELIVYADSLTIHSAPDVIHRTSLWRFM